MQADYRDEDSPLFSSPGLSRTDLNAVGIGKEVDLPQHMGTDTFMQRDFPVSNNSHFQSTAYQIAQEVKLRKAEAEKAKAGEYKPVDESLFEDMDLEIADLMMLDTGVEDEYSNKNVRHSRCTLDASGTRPGFMYRPPVSYTDPDGTLEQHSEDVRVLFPKKPCNMGACMAYLEALGGCAMFCLQVDGSDHYKAFEAWGVRRRSIRSWLNYRFPTPTRGLGIAKLGTPHKKMNCGCDCIKFGRINAIDRDHYAKYECWTIFGRGGNYLDMVDDPELEEYSLAELEELNRKRAVTLHVLSPKRYNIRIAGVAQSYNHLR